MFVIIGSSNGIVYERDRRRDLWEAKALCYALVEASTNLHAWVCDTETTEKKAGWWMDNRAQIREDGV